MIARARCNSNLTRVLMLFMFSIIASCSFMKDKGTEVDLLSIVVKGSEPVNHDSLNDQLIDKNSGFPDPNNLYFILSTIWPIPAAHYSLISINKIQDNHLNNYVATLIFDNIPDDDSVSGYRYDIKLKQNLHRDWEITEIRQSWRCWQGRGHRFFSVSPCS